MAFGDRDPEQLRDWQRRSREKARERARDRSSGGLKRSTGLSRTSGRKAVTRPEKPPEGPLTPLAWKLGAYDQADGLCEVTGVKLARPINPWVWHVHHVIPKQKLRDWGLYHLVWDLRNAMLLATRVHMQHEGAAERIPLEKLPPRVFDFAAEAGPRATSLLGPPVYPPTGSSGNDEEVT